MPDPPSFAEAEQNLRELEKALAERLGEARESNEDVPSINPAVGRLTFIDAYQQHQLDLHAQRNLSAQLASVRAALKRIEDGTYGNCMKCGIAIPPERLEYLPDTPYCTACKAG